MPVPDSLVGGLQLPFPAGAVGSATNDPTVDLLLAWCGHWIKWALDARLAVQVGVGGVDACPVGGRHGWNPLDTWQREEIAKPALFIWHSEGQKSSVVTLGYDEYRQRTLDLLYVFGELDAPSGMDARAGLIPAVDAVLMRSFSRAWHPTFGYGVYPATTPLRSCLTGNPDDFDAKYEGGTVGLLAAIPGGAQRDGLSADGREQLVFPALKGTITVFERLDTDTFVTPDDDNGQLEAAIRTNTEVSDPADVVDILEGIIP